MKTTIKKFFQIKIYNISFGGKRTKTQRINNDDMELLVSTKMSELLNRQRKDPLGANLSRSDGFD